MSNPMRLYEHLSCDLTDQADVLAQIEQTITELENYATGETND